MKSGPRGRELWGLHSLDLAEHSSDFPVQCAQGPIYCRPIFRRDIAFIHEQTRWTSLLFPIAQIVPN